jgi:hypothetical protein
MSIYYSRFATTKTAVLVQLLKESTKHLPKEIAGNITKRKLAQAMPVVGAAVGASFNYWFMSNTTRGAYMLFRQMNLARKYEPHDDGSRDQPPEVG